MRSIAEQKSKEYCKAREYAEKAIFNLNRSRQSMVGRSENTDRLGRKAVDACEALIGRIDYLLRDFESL